MKHYSRVTQVALTQGLVALVDEADFPAIEPHKWCAHRIGSKVYAATTVAGKTVHMHRILVAGAEVVDHRDGDGLNNSRRNLRAVNNRQNSINRVKRPGASQYKGVTRHPLGWMARVTSSGRTYFLGLFASEKAAAISYNRAARRLFGEFARLNEV